MNIDKTYIINLKERVDRKEKIIKALEKQNIINYEIFEGIRPDINIFNNWNSRYLKGISRYSLGCLGCLLSHYNIIKKALENNYETIMILEDDTIFKQDFTKLDEYLKDFNKKSIDMLYLSGSHMNPLIKVTNNIYKVTKTFTTNSYIITKPVMEFLVQNINGYDKEIDVFYSDHVQAKFNCYVTIPHITHQDSGYSDIQGGYVEYQMREKI